MTTHEYEPHQLDGIASIRKTKQEREAQAWLLDRFFAEWIEKEEQA